MPDAIVSVIIPCYRQANYLAHCVESVLGQDEAAEVIVVDDGSPDDTPSVANSFGDRIQYVRQENAGQAVARNTGYHLSKGQYLIFLDADDALLPGALRMHLGAAAESPNVGVFCGGRRDVDANNRLIRHVPIPEFGVHALHQLLPSNVAPPACFMVRRAAFEGVSGFSKDRNLLGTEDWDLWLRLAANGVRFKSFDDEVAAYRVTGTSVSWNIPRMFSSGMLTLRRIRDNRVACAQCRGLITQAMRNLRRYGAMAGIGGGLDLARTFGDVANVFGRAALMVKADPAFLPYALKAVLLHPSRRGIGAKYILQSTGRSDSRSAT